MGRMTAGITQMKTLKSAVSDIALPLPGPGKAPAWHASACRGSNLP